MQSVEPSGKDFHHRMGQQAQAVPEQGPGHQLGGALVERAPLEQHLHHRHPQQHQPHGSGQRKQHHPAQGVQQGAAQGLVLAPGRVRGKGGHGYNGHALGQHHLGHGHHPPGYLQRGQAAFGHARGQHHVNPEVQLHDGHAQPSGTHQTQHLAQFGHLPAQSRAKGPAREFPQIRQLHSRVAEGPQHRAPGQAEDAPLGRESHHAENHAQPVHGGRQRGQQKAPMHVEQGHEQSAHAEDYWRDQQHPEQAHRQALLLRGKARCQQMGHQPGRGHGHHQAYQRADQYQVGTDGRGQPPGPFPSALGQQLGEHRDEGRTQRAPGQQVEEHIRHPAGCVERVHGRARAEDVRDQNLPHQAHHVAQRERGHDPKGRPGPAAAWAFFFRGKRRGFVVAHGAPASWG